MTQRHNRHHGGNTSLVWHAIYIQYLGRDGIGKLTLKIRWRIVHTTGNNFQQNNRIDVDASAPFKLRQSVHSVRGQQTHQNLRHWPVIMDSRHIQQKHFPMVARACEDCDETIYMCLLHSCMKMKTRYGCGIVGEPRGSLSGLMECFSKAKAVIRSSSSQQR